MSDAAIGQIVTFLTVVLGFAITAWRENRNRHWAEQDRQVAAQQVAADRKQEIETIVTKAAAEAQASHLQTAALAERLRIAHLVEVEQLRADTKIGTEQVIAKLDHAIEEVGTAKSLATSAYSEANAVNLKIHDLNARIVTEGAATVAAIKEHDADERVVWDDLRKTGEQITGIEQSTQVHTEQLSRIEQKIVRPATARERATDRSAAGRRNL